MSKLSGIRRLLLLLSSILILPVDIYILICCYMLQLLVPSRQLGRRRLPPQQPAFRQHIIVVTGTETAVGLHVARAFSQAGHVVIGASFSTARFGGYGRSSSSLLRHYSLPSSNLVDYAQSLERIVNLEEADLWIACSDVTSPLEDVQVAEILRRRTNCCPFTIGFEAAEMLNDSSRFMQHLRSIDLPTLETYDVSSRSSIHKVLGGADKRGKKYVIKSTQDTNQSLRKRTVLPRRTLSQTYAHISELSVSVKSPWLLQEYIEGITYCTQAFVVSDEILMFTAWEPSRPSIVALSSSSAMKGALLKFIQVFLQKTNGKWTGHLGFDFRIQERTTEKGTEQLLYPIRARTALQDGVLVFGNQTQRLAKTYLRAISQQRSRGYISENKAGALIETHEVARNGLVEDLVSFGLEMLCGLLQRRQSLHKTLLDFKQIFLRICFWKDPLFEIWDPFPWWLEHHVKRPIALIKSTSQNIHLGTKAALARKSLAHRT